MGGCKSRAGAQTPASNSKFEVGMHLKSHRDLTRFPDFPLKEKTKLGQHLTKQVWDKLKDKSDDAGFSFKESIFTGCKHIDAGLGVYAGSPSSFKSFEMLYDPICEDYFGAKFADLKGKMDVGNLQEAAKNAEYVQFTTDEQRYIIDTRVRVMRNIEGYDFMPHITIEKTKELASQMKDKFLNLGEVD